MPLSPQPVLTGRSRTIEWHADLSCSATWVWGWSGYSYADSFITPTNALFPDHWFCDQSSCDYLAISVVAETGCTVDFSPPPDPVTHLPVQYITGYSGTASVSFGYTDWNGDVVTISTHSLGACPYPSGPGVVTASPGYTTPNLITGASWNSIPITLTGTVDYSIELHEAVDEHGAFYEVVLPGTYEKLDVTRQGGTVQHFGTTYTSIQSRSGANGGQPIPTSLYFGNANTLSTQWYGGGGMIEGEDGVYSNWANVNAFNAGGPLLSEGCTASCGPLYTTGTIASSGLVNPNVGNWGEVSSVSPPRGVVGENGGGSGGIDPHDVQVGGGGSPTTVICHVDMVRANATPETLPIDVIVLSGSKFLESDGIVGSTSITWSYGGWVQVRDGVTQVCTTPLTDSLAQSAEGGGPSESQAKQVNNTASVYAKAELAVHLAEPLSPIPSPSMFAARIGLPFNSVTFTQPASAQYCAFPYVIYQPSNNYGGGPPVNDVWQDNYPQTIYTGGGDFHAAPSGYVTSAPDGSGNMRVTVPTGVTNYLLHYTPSQSSATPGYRFLRLKWRTVGAAGQPLNISTGGIDINGAVSGADGVWVTQDFDILNPVYQPYPLTPAQVVYDGIIKLTLSGFAIGVVYEIAFVGGALKHDAFANGSTLYTDGLISNIVPAPGLEVPDYGGSTLYTLYNNQKPPVQYWGAVDLAPAVAGPPYGPLSDLYQNIWPHEQLWNVGIFDASGTSSGAYVSVANKPATLDGSGNASITLQSQQISTIVQTYCGCGNLLDLGGNPPYSATANIRFVAVTRATINGVEYGARPSPVTVTDKVTGHSVAAPTRATSGYFYDTGPGILIGIDYTPGSGDPPPPVPGPLTDVTTAAGAKKTICFPYPGTQNAPTNSYTSIAPTNNKLSNGVVGPGGIEYSLGAPQTTYLFIYSSGAGGRNVQNGNHPYTGYYWRIERNDSTSAGFGGQIDWRRTAAQAVPDTAGSLMAAIPLVISAGSSTYDSPAATIDSTGRLWAMYEQIDGTGNNVFETYSDDEGATWNLPVSLGPGILPTYGNSDAGGVGLRLPVVFVAGSSSPTIGTLVVTPTPAGQAANTATAKTIMYVSGGSIVPLPVTSDGHALTQGREGSLRWVLVCTFAGGASPDTAPSEWASADETGWTFTRLP